MGTQDLYYQSLHKIMKLMLLALCVGALALATALPSDEIVPETEEAQVTTPNCHTLSPFMTPTTANGFGRCKCNVKDDEKNPACHCKTSTNKWFHYAENCAPLPPNPPPPPPKCECEIDNGFCGTMGNCPKIINTGSSTIQVKESDGFWKAKNDESMGSSCSSPKTFKAEGGLSSHGY